MSNWTELEPGLYQVALPDEIRTVTSKAVLREADHFWLDKKWDPKARVEVLTLRTSTDGLLVQAEALGVHVVTRIVEMTTRYCRAEATGYRLRTDGLLEVERSTKEYDMTAELAKAALKAIPRGDKDAQPAPATSQALVRVETEVGALALIGTLPAREQVAILQARLEVQTHRLGLCETKAANRVIRYFVKKCGGVLKAQPGCKQIVVEFERAVLVKRLDPTQLKAATDSLFGGGQAAPAAPATAAPSVRAELLPDDDEPDDEHIPDEERTEERHVAGEMANENGGGVDDEANEPERIDHATGEVHDAAPAAGAPDDIITCHDCEGTVSEKSVLYCQSARGKVEFGGLNICYKCQVGRREQKGGAA